MNAEQREILKKLVKQQLDPGPYYQMTLDELKLKRKEALDSIKRYKDVKKRLDNYEKDKGILNDLLKELELL